MADLPKPESKVPVDPAYERRLREIQQHAKTVAAARRKGGFTRWYRPVGAGAPHDWAALSRPFDRQAANNKAIEAIQSSQSPGTSSDLIASTTMIDVLGVMDRAYRLRHTRRRPRAVAHATARMVGHGDDRGPILQCYLESVRQTVERGQG